MPHSDKKVSYSGYLSAINSSDSVSPLLGDTQNTEPDSILAVSPPQVQAFSQVCTDLGKFEQVFGMVGGAL
jgi:hypothetical protein